MRVCHFTIFGLMEQKLIILDLESFLSLKINYKHLNDNSHNYVFLENHVS